MTVKLEDLFKLAGEGKVSNKTLMEAAGLGDVVLEDVDILEEDVDILLKAAEEESKVQKLDPAAVGALAGDVFPLLGWPGKKGNPYQECGSPHACAICGRGILEHNGPWSEIVKAGQGLEITEVCVPEGYATSWVHRGCANALGRYLTNGGKWQLDKAGKIVRPTAAEVQALGSIINKINTAHKSNQLADLGSVVSCAICRDNAMAGSPLLWVEFSHSGRCLPSTHPHDTGNLWGHDGCRQMIYDEAKLDNRKYPDIRHLERARAKFTSAAKQIQNKLGHYGQHMPKGPETKALQEKLAKIKASKYQQQSQADTLSALMDALHKAGQQAVDPETLIGKLGPEGVERLQMILGKKPLPPSGSKTEAGVLPPAPKRRVLG